MEAVARLRNHSGSARKTRLVADLVRGLDAEEALNILKYTKKHAARPVEKLLVSAISNWTQKNVENDAAASQLYIKKIFVDGGRVLKRFRPAPYGRAHRIRKRTNHVTIIVDSRTGVGE
ncbi:MAG: 50S ribosomal protein L22 [Chitinophagales bacterium]